MTLFVGPSLCHSVCLYVGPYVSPYITPLDRPTDQPTNRPTLSHKPNDPTFEKVNDAILHSTTFRKLVFLFVFFVMNADYVSPLQAVYSKLYIEILTNDLSVDAFYIWADHIIGDIFQTTKKHLFYRAISQEKIYLTFSK